jgi:hypothetical protein
MSLLALSDHQRPGRSNSQLHSGLTSLPEEGEEFEGTDFPSQLQYYEVAERFQLRVFNSKGLCFWCRKQYVLGH